MARKKRRRGFFAVPVTTSVALSTLVNGIVIQTGLTSAFGREAFLISADLLWTLQNATATEGPIQVGLSHNNYSVTEVKEMLDSSSLDTSDKITQEQQRRAVRRAGIFSVLGADEVLNDGMPLRTRIKFGVNDGDVLNMWVMNLSGGTLTTGATVRAIGTLYGRWK